MAKLLAELTAALAICLFAAPTLAADNAHSSIDAQVLLECVSCESPITDQTNVLQMQEQMEQQRQQQQLTQLQQEVQDQVFNQIMDAATTKNTSNRTMVQAKDVLPPDSQYGSIIASGTVQQYVDPNQQAFNCCVDTIYYDSGYEIQMFYVLYSNGQTSSITHSVIIDPDGNVTTVQGLPPGINEQGYGTNSTATGAAAAAGSASGTNGSAGPGSTGNGSSGTAASGATSDADGSGSQ
ncbi:MAG: hypothetical protein ACLQJ0_04990 [Steroidobacteraceae bacterium]